MASHLSTQAMQAGQNLLGRYALKKILGQGAQATVWLAHDARLERDVALKLLRPEGQGGSVESWLQEARSLGRLQHPHIVTLYEAELFEGRPGLVLEYVSGPTLAQQLQRQGAMPVADAAALMQTLLAALQAAHEAGVVHRDFKPSNILLDPSGLAKVSDFGIATRGVSEGGSAGVPSDGTPGYMSPEAARGEAPGPASDVFSAGLVLAEMLFGQPMVAESDPYRAIYRLAHEDVALPASSGQAIDDGLRAIVSRALSRDLTRRFDSAQAFAAALKTWQDQALGQDTPASAASNGTLEFLLRRMRHKSDFPAMSEQIVKVQTLASSENESLNRLTNEILKDVALTNKLLRMVNTAQFAHASGGGINTVSRAVSLLGFSAIRNIALSLVLLEHMENKAHANQLKAEFLRSLLAGTVAIGLSPNPRESEEVFIGALFQNLGRLLSEFYFPEEAQQIRRAVESAGGALSEDQAAHKVLGLSYEELGLGVARVWGLPQNMQRLMRRPPGAPPSRPSADHTERLRWLTLASNELADTFLRHSPEELSHQLNRVAQKFAGSLGQSADLIAKRAHEAREKLVAMAEAMGLKAAPQTAAGRLLHMTMPAPPEADTLGQHRLTATRTSATASGQSVAAMAGGEESRAGAAAASAAPVTAPPPTDTAAAATDAPADAGPPATDMLVTGIQDVTSALVEDFQLNDVLRMILETMYRALRFQRVIFCLRDPATECLTGRFGLGHEVTQTVKLFRVSLKDNQNLFNAVAMKGLDTLIRDASAPNVASRLPDWHRQQVRANAFLLLPMQMKSATFGLIYADKAEAGSIELEEKELAMLKTLRNQAVMAFRQSRP